MLLNLVKSAVCLQNDTSGNYKKMLLALIGEK